MLWIYGVLHGWLLKFSFLFGGVISIIVVVVCLMHLLFDVVFVPFDSSDL